MISRRVSVKRTAERANSKACSPVRHKPHRPSIAGAGSPHCGQIGCGTGTRLDQQSAHAAPYRRSRTRDPHTTQDAGKRMFRIESITSRWGNAKGDVKYSTNSTLTRRFAPPSPRGRGTIFRPFPLPLGEGGAKRRVRVEISDY